MSGDLQTVFSHHLQNSSTAYNYYEQSGIVQQQYSSTNASHIGLCGSHGASLIGVRACMGAVISRTYMMSVFTYLQLFSINQAHVVEHTATNQV